MVDQTYMERQLCKIFLIYLKNGFVPDLIAIIPFYLLLENHVDIQYRHYLFFIKLIRLLKGLKVFDKK
jgi:hypothetical protein